MDLTRPRCALHFSLETSGHRQERGSKVSAIFVDGEAALQQVLCGCTSRDLHQWQFIFGRLYKQGNFGNLGKQACPMKEMHCRELEEKTPKGPENLPEYSRTINRT